MKKNEKIISLAMAAMLAMNSNQAISEETSDSSFDEAQSATATNTGAINSALDRQKLVDALKSMKNKPEEINFHSAMCYKMAMPPAVYEYTCPDCGQISTHKYQSIAGRLSRQIASVRRSLPNLPVKISVNETALCQKCSKTGQPELAFTTNCGNCAATFTWKITSDKELAKLDWLFLDYPVKSISSGPGRGKTIDPDKVREMVEFVSGCFFCPECIEKLQLNYKN